MPLLFSSFKECFGFSHMIKLTSRRLSTTLLLISLRFPIGVATMYKVLIKVFVLILLVFIIYSCTPRIIANEDILTTEKDKNELTKVNQKEVREKQEQEVTKKSQISLNLDDNNDKKIISEDDKMLFELDFF